jgi:hypothetical protein
MRRILAILTVAAVLAAGIIAWALPRGAADLPPPVPSGDAEVAYIQAATSGASWERFVAGVHRARHDWPQLYVDDSRAFLDQTTAVPEVILGVEGTAARLHVRWYKLTSAARSAAWVRRLATRDVPPLAFIGGGTSDRAEALARALADEQSAWHGPAPLLLITTATANGVGDTSQTGPNQKSLMDLYPGRSFRFCFTNEQMAKAVVDFVWSQPNLRPIGDPFPVLSGVAAAAAGPLTAALVAVRAEEQPPVCYALSWDDDPYSTDLASQFHAAFHQSYLPPVIMEQRWSIPFSVGEFDRPNAVEAQTAERLLQQLRTAPYERRVLILPAGAAQARRVLHELAEAVANVRRRVVAVGGDSVNVNTVFRDADMAWRIRAIKVPFVFFAHQNPVAWDVDPEQKSPNAAKANDPGALLPPTATDDVLLNAFLVRLLVESAYGTGSSPALTASPEELAARLRNRRPAVFDADGNRLAGVGEYVVTLSPRTEGGQAGTETLPWGLLEVWTRDSADRPTAAWRKIKSLVTDHARRPESAP